MKNILLAVSLMLALAVGAQAQTSEDTNPPAPPQQGGLKKFPNMIDCDETEKIIEVIKRYEEMPLGFGTSVLVAPNGQLMRGNIAMFWNPDKKTFSLIFQVDEQYSCMVSGGSIQMLLEPPGVRL